MVKNSRQPAPRKPSPERSTARPGALDGIVVIDLTQAIAGPFATRILAELGARVIKVESPSGDLVRTVQWADGNDPSPMFAHGSRGKESVAVDLGRPEGKSLVMDLISQADVVVENFRPGTLARLGFDPEQLVALPNSPVVCSVSGFGQTGPCAGWSGADPAGQALSGMTYMIGEREGTPYLAANGIADTTTAMWAATSVLAALRARDRDGQGCWLDISMSDAMVAMDCVTNPLAAVKPEDPSLHPSGHDHPAVCPFGVFPCTDGYIVVEALGEGPGSTWGGLCRVLGREDLIDDPQTSSQNARVNNRTVVNSLIEDWCSRLDRWTAVNRLQEERVIAAPVVAPSEIPELELFRSRGIVTDNGAVALPLTAAGLAGSPGVPPRLGEHNTTVLTELLDLTTSDVVRLEQDEVLWSRSMWP